MPEKNYDRIDAAANILAKGLVLLIPVFFLPWTALRGGLDSFSKLYLFYLVVPVLAMIFLYKFWRGKKPLSWGRLDILAALFVFFYGLSALFGSDRLASFFGSPAGPLLPWFAVFLIMVFYFVISRSFDRALFNSLLRYLVLAHGLLAAGAAILVGGLWTGVFSGQGRLAGYFSLAGGSLEDFAVTLAAMTVAIFILLADGRLGEEIFSARYARPGLQALLVFSLLALAVINFSPAWWCLLAGAATWLAIGFFNAARSPRPGLSGRFSRAAALAMILLPIVFLSGYYFSGSGNERRLAKQLQLDYPKTMTLAKNAVARKPLFGYGPENFSYAYSLARPAEFNQNEFWYVRYSRGASFLSELAVTGGLFGLFGFLSIIGYLFYRLYKLIRFPWAVNAVRPEKMSSAALSASVLAALIVAGAAYSLTIVTFFLFWLFAAFFMAGGRGAKQGPESADEKNKKIGASLSSSPILPVLLIMLCAGYLVLLGLTARHLAGKAHYRAGTATLARGAETEEARAERNFLRAAELNPRDYTVSIALSKIYLNRVLSTLDRVTGSDLEMIQNTINQSLFWARQAAETAPNAVAAAENLAAIYLALSPYAEGSEEVIIGYFSRALALEPTNPVLRAELGKVYSRQGDFKEAIGSFKAALSMKQDYYEAEFGLAKAFSRADRPAEALELFSGLESRYNQTEVFFEQGRIQYNQGNYAAAAGKFQDVLRLAPNHANALYSLALALEAAGDKPAARKYYEQVLTLNPGNPEVLDRIRKLDGE